MRMHRNTLLMAVLLLAACGSEPSDDAVRAPVPDSAAAAPSAAVPPAAGGAGDSTAAAPAAPPSVVLAPDGVEITNGAGAPARLAFGAARDPVLAQVGAVMNGPGEQAEQEECPAGPLTTTQYPSGLQLVFQDGNFVGWAAQPRPGSTLRTAPGIGIGSTVGQLRAAYPVATVGETSLGIEFTAGDLYGIVSDSTAAGQVEIMFAGINCIFR
jgi:hypothetical protein